MKPHHIGLIVALTALVGGPVRAAEFNVALAIRPLPAIPVLPVTLPGRPLPIPTAIPGPAIQLPGPAIPLVSIPGVVEVKPFVPAQPVQNPIQKGFFACAQKTFAAAPGQSVGVSTLNAAFDTGSKPSAPAVKGEDAPVEIKDEDAVKPAKRRRPVERSIVIGIPTHELEREIGI